MLKSILIYITLFITSAMALAAPKRVEIHGKGFAMSRQIYVIAEDYDARICEQISQTLQQAGIKALVSNKKTITKSRIIITRVSHIDGVNENDALHIKVSPKRILLQYTTSLAREKAIEYIIDLLTSKDKTIPGQDIYDWGSSRIKQGVIDAASKFISLSEIESAMKYYRKNNVMLCLTNENNWRLKNDIFGIINPNTNIFSNGNFYTYEQIANLITRYAGRVIPMIDLLGNSNVFEKITGHSPSSVEGMRFVRAIIEECVEKTKTRKICVGKLPENADQRFVNFLKDIGARHEVEIIMMSDF